MQWKDPELKVRGLTKSDLRLSQDIIERTEAMYNMKKLILSVFILTFGFATAMHAQQVNTLFKKQLPETPGKEIEVITGNYAPGAVDAIHRHDAHAVVYVLEGEVEMLRRQVPSCGDGCLAQLKDIKIYSLRA
jgi:hypothetical protein